MAYSIWVEKNVTGQYEVRAEYPHIKGGSFLAIEQPDSIFRLRANAVKLRDYIISLRSPDARKSDFGTDKNKIQLRLDIVRKIDELHQQES